MEEKKCWKKRREDREGMRKTIGWNRGEEMNEKGRGKKVKPQRKRIE